MLFNVYEWTNGQLAILVLLVAAFSAACGSLAASGDEQEKTVANRRTEKAVETVVVAATERQVPKYIEATGSFAADETTEVAPEIAGRVEAVLAGEGAFVAAGSVILKLSETDARLRLEQARAAEAQALAQIRQSEAAVGQAEAQFKQAQAALGLERGGNFASDNIPEVRQARAALRSAESDLRLAEATERRYATLLETGDTSKLVVDGHRNEAEKARAAVNEARERLRAAENAARGGNQAVNAAQAGVNTARANVENARAAFVSAQKATALAAKTVADATVRAPFSGFVNSRPAAVGEYVSPSAPVAVIVRINPLKLRLAIPEAEAGNVRVGMSVSARVAAFANRNFAGRVSAVHPNLDAAARTLQVDAVFENPENILRPGMFAAAKVLQPGGETGIYVPRSAIVKTAATDSLGVYAIERDGTARLRVVQTQENEPEEASEIRIISGISAGERVAASNLGKLFDGAKIPE